MSWEPIDLSNPDEMEVIGDESFDAMAETIEKIAALYKAEFGRLPTANELVTTFKQALETRIGEVAKEGNDHELQYVKFKLKKISKRQKFSTGDVLRGKLENGEYVFGRIFAIDESLGPQIGVYDSKGMEQNEIDEIISRPLIVKITPIHFEIMQDKSEWLVIGNRPLKTDEMKNPHGPKSISGDNNQLIAANYFYKLTSDKYYDIDEWTIKPKDQ